MIFRESCGLLMVRGRRTLARNWMNGVGSVIEESVGFGNLNFTCACTCLAGPFSFSREMMLLGFACLCSFVSLCLSRNSQFDLDYGLLLILRQAC